MVLIRKMENERELESIYNTSWRDQEIGGMVLELKTTWLGSRKRFVFQQGLKIQLESIWMGTEMDQTKICKRYIGSRNGLVMDWVAGYNFYSI